MGHDLSLIIPITLHLLLVLIVAGTYRAVRSNSVFFAANNLNEVDEASIILDSFCMNFSSR